MTNINIDGVEYTPTNTDGEKLEIVCVDNHGLMFVGFVDFAGDSEFVLIKKARCIIRWGTKEHVAQLIAGPTDTTMLGESADVLVARKNVQYRYQVSGEWGV